jgi:hypothetical protein
MFPIDLRLDAGVVRELRGAGKILAEVEWDDTWGDVNIFGRILIVDGGEPDINAAVAGVTARLEELDWRVKSRYADQIFMESARWENVILGVERADTFSFDELKEGRVGLAIQSSTKRSENGTPVVMHVRPVDS